MTLRHLRNEFSVAGYFKCADCWPIVGRVDPDFRCRRQQADAPVTVLLVVPAEEPAAEVEAVVVTGGAGWEVGPVLQRLELTL
jgi:hypothetical protein